jgi:hypothetical protein
MIIAIDPGTTESAYVVYSNDGVLLEFEKTGNEELLEIILSGRFAPSKYVIEMIASYGMPVGREVFETCLWIGRFIQASNGNSDLVYRKDVKMHLCGSTRAKDSNIRQAIMDLYGTTKQEVIGLKKSPGPLYGVSGDVWAALGVAITYTKSR